ncbi:MAG: leucine-rich repeat protein [Bacilli bacterium]|nr:leucine-rich repeat protein [Bacilli bacterium]
MAKVNVVGLDSQVFKNTSGWLNPNIISIDLSHVPFVDDDMATAFATNNSAFSALTSVTNIHQNTTDMYGAFYECKNLTTVDASLPNPVTDMKMCFYNCSNLVNVPTLPSNVVDLHGCFFNCTNIIHAPTIPNSVTNMQETFYGCNHMTDINSISNSVTNGVATFYNCMNLTSANITLPNTLINAAYMFTGCRNLVSAPDMPDSVTNTRGTYGDCVNLRRPPKISNNTTDMHSTFMFDERLEDIPAIPNTVTALPKTFLITGLGDLANSTNRVLPNSITSMWISFAKSNATTSPILPNSVTVMKSTFYMCDKLTVTPTIPDSVTNMTGTFCACTNLTNITNLPPNLVNMGCGGTDMVPEDPPFAHVIGTGCFADCIQLTSDAIPPIPNSVKDMTATFYDCPNLTTTPNLPTSLVNMAECFMGCTNLTTVSSHIPNTTVNMQNAFRACNNLVGDIHIDSTEINMVTNCFYGTTAAKNVYIPFIYQNGINTKTYNTFTSYGYDNAGTKEGVYLKNNTEVTVTIVPDPADATVTFNTPGTVSGNSITVLYGTNISYTVSKPAYDSGTFSTVADSTKTVNAPPIELTKYTLTISTTPASATVTFNDPQGTVSGKSITVLPGTVVSYTVSGTNLTSATYSETVNSTKTVSKKAKVTLTVNPTYSSASVSFSTSGTRSGNSLTVDYGTNVTYSVSATNHDTNTQTESSLSANKTVTPKLHITVVSPIVNCNSGTFPQISGWVNRGQGIKAKTYQYKRGDGSYVNNWVVTVDSRGAIQSMSVSGNVSGSAASNVTLTPTGGWTDGDFWE